MDPLKTGRLISIARKRLNMTQKDLANKLFVSDKAVSKWERGLSFPDIGVLIPLSEILEINLYDLLKGEEMKEKQDDTILIETIKYSNEEKSKLKKILGGIIIIMSIMLIIMIGFIIIAKLPKNDIIVEEKMIPGQKFSVQNYVGTYKIATKEINDGWVCKMQIDYPPDWSEDKNTDYYYNCFNIKYKELPGFNYYHYNIFLDKYYLDNTNYPSYMHNINYKNELMITNKYFNEQNFNKEITLSDLDKLELKLIDKKVLLEVYNMAINSKEIDSYGSYPNGYKGVFNYEYTSFETGETYVVGFYLDLFGYIKDVYIDTKNGDYYSSDLINSVSKFNTNKEDREYILNQLLNKKNKFDKIEKYIVENQKFSIPVELKNDEDAIELTKYHFKVINNAINHQQQSLNNIMRYVKDIREMDGQDKEFIDN